MFQSPEMTRRLTWICACFAAICLASAGLLIIATFIPLNRQQQETGISIERLRAEGLSDANVAMLRGRSILLDWPARMRTGEGSSIVLTLGFDEAARAPGEAVSQAALSEPPLDGMEVHLVALARLETGDFDVFQGERREVLPVHQEHSIRWDLRSRQPGTSRVKVWLYLEMVPVQSGRPIEQYLLLSRWVEVPVVDVFGMPIGAARVLGVICLVAAVAGFFLSIFVRRKAALRSGSSL